jgi:hypothetical protein
MIALLVLMPRRWLRSAASRSRLQTSFNLALGSVLASIGLTIPAIAVASIWLNDPLLLGLDGKEVVLLALTVTLNVLTIGTGRAPLLQGTVCSASAISVAPLDATFAAASRSASVICAAEWRRPSVGVGLWSYRQGIRVVQIVKRLEPNQVELGQRRAQLVDLALTGPNQALVAAR